MNCLYVKDRREWRAWLKKNGQSMPEVWLIYYKKASRKGGISYGDSVEEALCFGWIDSTVRKLDKERFLRRFTPRKPGSRWAASNIKRVRKLTAEGKMTAVGLARFQPQREANPLPNKMPADLEQRFRRDAQAWRNFHSFPPFYRRMAAAWVARAKKEETRLRRLQKLMKFSLENRRIR